MQRNDNSYNHQKPPRIPPLSVSLPSPPRLEPDPPLPVPAPQPKPKPKPVSKLKPKLTLISTPSPNPRPTSTPTQQPPNQNPTPPNPRTTPTPTQQPPNPRPTSTPTQQQPNSRPTSTVPTQQQPNLRTTSTPSQQPNIRPAQTQQPNPRPMPTQPPNPRSGPTLIIPQQQPQVVQSQAPDPKSEAPHSPLRSESPTGSDDPDPNSPPKETALVPHEKFYSPLTSPLPITPPKDSSGPPPPSQHVINFSRRDDTSAQSGVAYGGERKDRGDGGGGGRVEGLVRRPRKEEVVLKAALGVRVLEIVFCLISFSVMAADKTQGWSGDSFDRYKEYRFCLTVAIFGFLYSAFQAYDLASHLVTGKHVISHHLRYQFDFIMDQILAYLLISASSAAASRVDDWQANWGKDEFTEKASASISMAFLAFICFAMSSLISGYNLCNRDLY